MVRVLSRTPLVQRIRHARRTIPVGCLFLYDHLIFFMSFVDSLSLSFIFFLCRHAVSWTFGLVEHVAVERRPNSTRAIYCVLICGFVVSFFLTVALRSEYECIAVDKSLHCIALVQSRGSHYRMASAVKRMSVVFSNFLTRTTHRLFIDFLF